MPDSSDRPFGQDTLKLRAMFVPERASTQPSNAAITSAVGHGAVKIPAVIVPQGGKPPGQQYVHVGKAEFRPDQDRGMDSAATRTFTGQQSPQPAQPGLAEPDQMRPLPRTRTRFGGGQGDGYPPAPPPNPAHGGFAPDTMRAAIHLWRSIRNAGRMKSGSQPSPAGPPAAQEGADTHGDTPPSAQDHARQGAQRDTSPGSDQHVSRAEATLPPDTP